MARTEENPASKGGQHSAQPGYGGVSAAEVETYIKGIDFPCDKEACIEHARKNGAPDEVLDLMEQLPEGEYRSAVDIAKGVSQAKQTA